jgi:serine/threonine-protein kinase
VRLNPDLPDELERIINKSLEKDASLRFQHSSDLQTDLKRLKRDTSGESVATIAAPTAIPVQRNYLWPVIVGGPGIIVVLLALFWPFTAAPPEEAFDSIAVLPFENVTNDSDWDFLSDGISEDIINSLSQMNDLKVISRASSFRYRERDIDPQAVGNELGVRALVTGRVLVRGDDLSIRAELIDVGENTQLWGGEFNGKLREILEMRKSIATEISDELSLRLTPEEANQITRTYTEDDQAHAAYLKGKFEEAKGGARGHQRAIQYFEQAIERDPNYAQAWAALARSHYRLVLPYRAASAQEAMPKAEEAAMKALELDDSLSAAHAVLADVKRAYHWNWAGAEEEYKLALELDPGSFDAPNQYAFFLSGMGRHDESAVMGRRAQELNPLDPSMRTGACARLGYARRYEEAIEQCQAALELEPDYISAYRDLGQVYEYMGLYPKAAAARQKELTLDGASEEEVAGLTTAAISGKEEYWQWMQDYWRRKSAQGYVSPNTFASIYASLGDKDQAFEWLEKAYQARILSLLVMIDPIWDPIRDDPRFTDLLRRMNLEP